VELPDIPASVADTIGAGDAFTAATPRAGCWAGRSLPLLITIPVYYS